ncbi:MAG: chemotaxis protein CheW [Planctomycetota bacterium]
MAKFNHGLSPWIILRVDRLEYALHINVIVEVLRMVAVRPLPDAYPWIAGIMNIRGRGVPVMDLRKRLGMPAIPYTPQMIIVVIEVAGSPLGIIVDQAVEFLAIPEETIRPPDRVSGDSGILSGVAHAGERLILILDPRCLMAVDHRRQLPGPSTAELPSPTAAQQGSQ